MEPLLWLPLLREGEIERLGELIERLGELIERLGVLTERLGALTELLGVNVLRGAVVSERDGVFSWRPTVVRVLLWRVPPKLPFWLL